MGWKSKTVRKVELSTVHELILSEQDGAVFNAHLQREALNRRVCETIRSYLKEFRSKDDEFTLVGNSRGFATIIHAQGPQNPKTPEKPLINYSK